MATKELKIKITGDSSGLVAAVDESNKKMGSLSAAAVKGVAAFAAVGAGIAVGLFKVGEQFDKAYDYIRVGTGATGEALVGLQNDFKEVAKNSGASFSDIGIAIGDINTRLGLTGKPLQDLSKQVLQLSKITKSDLTESIDKVTRLFGDWSISTDKQSKTLDYLYLMGQATGTAVNQLADMAVYVGAPMRSLGFTFEETAALIAKWNKEGVNTELVLAGLKVANGKFAKEFGEDSPKAFRAFMEEIKKAPSASAGAAIAIEKLGVRAGPDFAAAVMEGRFEIDDLMKAVAGSSDTIAKSAADISSFSGKWAKLKNQVLVGLEPLAKQVFDAMGKAIDKMSPLINQFMPYLVEGIGRVGRAFRDVVLYVEQFQPVIERIASVIGENLATAFHFLQDNFDKVKLAAELVGPPLGVALGALLAFQQIKAATLALQGFAIAAKVVTGAFLANPFGIAFAAITAIGTALWIAYKRSERFRQIVEELKNRFQAVADVVSKVFKEKGFAAAVREAMAGIKGAFVDLGQWLQSTGLPWLKQKSLALAAVLGDWIQTAAAYLQEHLPGWLATLGNWLVGTALPWLGEQTAALARKLGGWVNDAVMYLRDNLPGWLGALTEWIVGTALPWLIEQGASMALKMADWVLDASAMLIKNLPGWLADLRHWMVYEALPALWEFGKDAAGKIKDAMMAAMHFTDDVAREIVEGLIRGLGKMASRLWSGLVSFISDNVPGPIKEALGINSPSRVMMPLGASVGEGLALGIAGSAGLVSSAAAGLASAAQPSFGGLNASYAGADLTSDPGAWTAAPIVVQTYLDGREIAVAMAPHQRTLERSKR